jgi:acetyl-CoA C-acetyltransferase
MKRICIVRAKRTPQGRYLGALSKYSIEDLGEAAGRAVLKGIDPALVDLVVMGRVLPPDLNVARVISRLLEIPDDKAAYTVNMQCASGLKAITLAADAIQLGQATIVLCGGLESMSNVPHVLEGLRTGIKFGDAKLLDYIKVGLTDAIIGKMAGVLADMLAQKYDIDRVAQDKFALASHQKAIAAQQSGGFDDEIVPLPELDRDEHPRGDTSLEKLASLKPAFGEDGTVTAGNASGINDGAAMVLLCDEQTAQKHGWKPLAYINATADIGVAPAYFGIGPAAVLRKICEKTGQPINNYDTIELNEAFACQVIACLRELGLPDDEARINPEGGGVAVGHPVGASGARLAVHLAHKIARGDAKNTVATLCVGGGMGIAANIAEQPT